MMTAKKNLKKRVRSRQQQTGERYTAALEHVKQAGLESRACRSWRCRIYRPSPSPRV
jgi:hypothetical protein